MSTKHFSSLRVKESNWFLLVLKVGFPGIKNKIKIKFSIFFELFECFSLADKVGGTMSVTHTHTHTHTYTYHTHTYTHIPHTYHTHTYIHIHTHML